MTKSIFTARYERFRRLLVEARQTAEYTQRDLAEQLGRPQSFVSKVERGERRLDVVEFLEVAEVLRVDVAAFFAKLAESQLARRRAER